MQIKVKVNTNSQVELVEKISDDSFKVKFKAERLKGKANEKLVKILARYFNMDVANIKIVSGFTSTNKIVVLEHWQR